jgi:hypothetical protein
MISLVSNVDAFFSTIYFVSLQLFTVSDKSIYYHLILLKSELFCLENFFQFFMNSR